MNDIKIVFTDIDGVWTDGSMYYLEGGGEMKRFHTYDSAGVLLCKNVGLIVTILTGEKSDAVIRRAEKLGVIDVHIGVTDKLKLAQSICKEKGILMSEAAFIGDDLNDLRLLKKVGLSACPAQSPQYVKDVVDWVLPIKGGDGAFRCFIEKYLDSINKLDRSVQEVLNNFNRQ